MLTAIVGINWGDEGKGRMVDLLSGAYDIVARYQGGNNAGHTVVNEKGKFILNLIPSGILREGVVNVMGNGMVIDIEHLAGEVEKLVSRGVRVTPENLRISDRACLCLPWHKDQDGLEEDRLGDNKQGSTRRGIGPAYADKYYRKTLRMGDLLEEGALADKVAFLAEWKNIVLCQGYGRAPYKADEVMGWLHKFGDRLRPFVMDTDKFMADAAAAGKKILLEAQLGALRDIDYGIFPYTTSSSAIAAYAPIGAGVPALRLDSVIGIMKAYSSSVGGGPFVAELFGQEGEDLRAAGNEYGAATGRPRRVGPFDIPASRYGVRVQGPTTLALTKLDVLSYLERIPVCVAYEIDGERVAEFVTGDKLLRAKPVVEYREGFRADISGARKLADLPAPARAYIEYLQESVGCHIGYVSVGASRDDYIEVP